MLRATVNSNAGIRTLATRLVLDGELAEAAAQRCTAAGHDAWTRLNGVACGPCLETALREDDRNQGGRPGVVTPLARRQAAS
jgi:hypothetical protein